MSVGKMSTRRRQLITEFEHTPQVLERRKSLFPSEEADENDSELGHISPLDFNSDTEEEPHFISKTDSISDYDIIGVVDKDVSSVYTPIHTNNYACSETMSPLYLSPQKQIASKAVIINETPAKFSPSQNHKTPHDSTTKNQNLPKLLHKSLLDETTSVKRKLSPSDSPASKIMKIDPKVRTALFPEENDMSVPVKNFYAKSDVDIIGKLIANREKLGKSMRVIPLKTAHRARKKYGQINNGVGHKIRKPRQKKIKSGILINAAKKLIKNDLAITEYIRDLSEMKKTQSTVPKLGVEPQKMIRPAIDENKENSSKNVEVKKRQIECEEETMRNRKFFKHSHSRGIVNMSKGIRVAVDHGKMSLIENDKQKPATTPIITFDANDFAEEPEKDTSTTDLDNLISNLEDESPNKIILQAHSSVMASENSIQLHHHEPMNVANLILSPISQMCDVTSGLVLTSPKKARNLSTVLDNMPNASTILNKASSVDCMENKKLFPIFVPGGKNAIKESKVLVVNRGVKKFKKISSDQMLLDAGQRRFGATQCTECGFVYHMGDPGDEIMHQNYHDAGHVFKFAGWKNEHVIASFNSNCRIVKVLPTDSKIWIKKVKELMAVVNRDLGCYDMEFNIDNSEVYLYIKNKTIVGCAVVVSVGEAHKMLSSDSNQPDTCSEETYPVKCGISRIWVSHNYRKQGVATALMNAVKSSYVLGHVLTDKEIAMSAPTDLGKTFATSYFKTANFLIYFP